ncbi:hypothetical protein [Spirillospora sp. NPDC048819]|uniref:hypothetical protein n=1 Tax=Spirillospora sp. NPDC048819 TaxID=3155268 RepID=UPI0033F0DA18
MVGADHPSGTDTKVETADKPDKPYTPPPDNPGSPGQPSRRESYAAARAAAESGSGGEQRDVKPSAEKTEPAGESQGEERPAPEAKDRDRSRPAEEQTDAPEAEKPRSEVGREPNDDPNTVGRPRAESIARAIELQKEYAAGLEASDRTDDGAAQPPQWDTPAQEGPADETGDSEPDPPEAADEAAPDIGRETDDTGPPTDQDAPEPAEEGPEEFQDGPGDDTGDPGRNIEDQAESQGTDEDDPVIYRIRLPDGEELGPSGTDRWVYHSGRLDPVNENQDLSEPDPEDGDRMNRILRAARDNPDDAEKHLDNVVSNMIKALEKPPPAGRPISGQDVSNRGDRFHDGPQSDVKGASALVGAAVVAMMALKAKDVIGEKIKEHRRGDDGDH